MLATLCEAISRNACQNGPCSARIVRFFTANISLRRELRAKGPPESQHRIRHD